MGNASGKAEVSNGGSDWVTGEYTAAGESFPASLTPSGGGVEYMANSPPPSPSRSRSPQLFSPHQPAASMRRVDVSPFNPMRPGESHESVNRPLGNGIPTMITWTHDGNNVAVEGSWDNWTSRKPLQIVGKDHILLLVLPSGIFHYRFIVDGEIKHAPELPSVSDEMGNLCQVLDVNDSVPENLDSISEFEAPGSPLSSYNQDLPEDEDFSRDPVQVPQQLHVTVLEKPKEGEVPPTRPRHVVLNHLYLEKGRSAQSVVALGLTHRFESKYVTVVLYKPVAR